MLKVDHYAHAKQVAQLNYNHTTETVIVNRANKQIELIKETLSKLHLEIHTVSHTKTGSSKDWLALDSLKVSIRAKAKNSRFKFIADRGYTAGGQGANHKTLKNKADKITKALNDSTGMKFSTNQYSLEESNYPNTERIVIIEGWLGQI
jgi:hypothetical protein